MPVPIDLDKPGAVPHAVQLAVDQATAGISALMAVRDLAGQPGPRGLDRCGISGGLSEAANFFRNAAGLLDQVAEWAKD